MVIMNIDMRPSYVFFVLLILFPMASSITDSEALLRLKESFVNAKALDSWKPEANACAKNQQWAGVICGNGIVTDLRLARMNLSGNIDIDALAQIPGLRSLSFVNNLFSGPLPEFNRMGALRGIYLSGNRFSGDISANSFLKMVSLKKLWLSENKLTGEIPSSLTELPYLIELHLENNQFSGPIPPFKQITLMSLSLANNNLSGEIPPGLSKFNESSFKGNPGLCGEKLGNPCSNTSVGAEDIRRTEEHRSRKMSIGFLTASSVMLAFMFAGIYVLRRRQENEVILVDKENLDETLGGSISGMSARELSASQKRSGSSRKGSRKGISNLVMVNDDKGAFGLTDLMKAAAEVLGNGLLGSSYKVTMCNGLTVVVKRMKEMTQIGEDVFDAEIRRLGKLKHPNVLTPLAYHYRKDEKLLVYEYIPMGCLLYLLHGDRGPCHAELNWPTRLKIIQGVARGLGYLHTELASLDLPHGDLKSSNVLLSFNYEPLLVDYGFSSLISSNQARESLFAYKSPEAVQHLQVSPKCDVYCLGIIILELLTGKFPSQYVNNNNGGTDVVQWVKSAIGKGREAELFDPEIASSINSLGEMENLFRIGAACTESDPAQRLDIEEAIRRIEGVQIEGSREARNFHEMPSLRDGCADSLTSHSQRLDVHESYGALSGRRRDNFGDRSARGTSDTFAFDIS